MIGKNYIESYNYIPLLIIGAVFSVVVSFIGGIYTALKKTKSIAMTSFWSGVINVLVNLLMINKYGIYAAAISTIVSYAIMSIYRYNDVQKFVKLKINNKLFVFMFFCMLLICYLYYKKDFIYNIVMSFISLFIFIFLNYKNVFDFLTLFKKKIFKKKVSNEQE